jgi:spore germination protein
MEIYVVQQGDTIASIAEGFGVSTTKLIIDNGLTEPYNLAVGQTIVITYPTETYIIQSGDTLESIAEAFGIPVMQLLRNNPDLAGREFIYPGETINISFQNTKGKLSINGVAYPFIRDELLRKTLPYLTYLTIFNYQVSKQGEIMQNTDDMDIIRLSKEYGVAPIMLLTTLSSMGLPNAEAAFEIILNPQVQDQYIVNILNILQTKGYYGIDITFQYVTNSNLPYYINLINKISSALKPLGYAIFVTINPRLNTSEDGVIFENVDYSQIAQIADGVTFISYDWGFAAGPPPPISLITTPAFLDMITSQIPLEKIRLAMPTLGYDWQLPYIEGLTLANALNFDSAIDLAKQVGAEIQYNEDILSAYFNYFVSRLGQQLEHIVWFKDARSVEGSLNILNNYGIHGITEWNIMYYFEQMWLVINTQYEIEKVLNEF